MAREAVSVDLALLGGGVSMLRRSRRVLSVVLLGLALSALFASSASAFPWFGRHRLDTTGSLRLLRERGVFSFLGSLFGKSRGAMDPNGGVGDPPPVGGGGEV